MKVLVPIAPGFEEIEAVTIIDILRRSNIEVVSAGLDDIQVKGSHNIEIKTDALVDDITGLNFDAVVLPGGMPGSDNLRKDSRIISMLLRTQDNGGIVAAICAAPIVLSEAGLTLGKTVTCFPGFESDIESANCTGSPVEVDGSLITGRGPGCAIAFSLAIVERLVSKEAALKLRKGMQVYWEEAVF